MPTHETSTRNAIADVVVDRVDVGSTNAAGKIRVYTANHISLLAEIDMANPAFGPAVVGIAPALGLPLADSLADAPGSAAEFDAIDRDEDVVFSGTVGIDSSFDMTVPNTEVSLDDIIKIISLNYTAPP